MSGIVNPINELVYRLAGFSNLNNLSGVAYRLAEFTHRLRELDCKLNE
jgi:hypothetical protein